MLISQCEDNSVPSVKFDFKQIDQLADVAKDEMVGEYPLRQYQTHGLSGVAFERVAEACQMSSVLCGKSMTWEASLQKQARSQ